MSFISEQLGGVSIKKFTAGGILGVYIVSLGCVVLTYILAFLIGESGRTLFALSWVLMEVEYLIPFRVAVNIGGWLLSWMLPYIILPALEILGFILSLAVNVLANIVTNAITVFDMIFEYEEYFENPLTGLAKNFNVTNWNNSITTLDMRLQAIFDTVHNALLDAIGT